MIATATLTLPPAPKAKPNAYAIPADPYAVPCGKDGGAMSRTKGCRDCGCWEPR